MSVFDGFFFHVEVSKKMIMIRLLECLLDSTFNVDARWPFGLGGNNDTRWVRKAGNGQLGV